MITGDLDRELTRRLPGVARQLGLPDHSVTAPAATWRPVAGRPASFATALPLQIGQAARCSTTQVADALAAALAEVSWIEAAGPTGAGYLTLSVTAEALAQVAARFVAAGPGCARSQLLRGRKVLIAPWPDIAGTPNWHAARQSQARAMTARLAECAGASAIRAETPGSSTGGGQPSQPAGSHPAAAVEYYGVAAVRYMVARTFAGRARQLAELADRIPRLPAPYQAVQLAHAEAASTLRWAAELGLDGRRPAEGLAAGLADPVERDLLGLLSWLPEKVASAARRRRPAEIPRFLEELASAWTAARLYCPALPFGGAAAAMNPVTVGARLLLADAIRTALAAGLALTGIPPDDRI